MEKLCSRKGEIENMDTRSTGMTHLEIKIPARGLIGYRSEFLTDTNGNGIMNQLFGGYEPYKGEIATRTHGPSWCTRPAPPAATVCGTLRTGGGCSLVPV